MFDLLSQASSPGPAGSPDTPHNLANLRSFHRLISSLGSSLSINKPDYFDSRPQFSNSVIFPVHFSFIVLLMVTVYFFFKCLASSFGDLNHFSWIIFQRSSLFLFESVHKLDLSVGLRWLLWPPLLFPPQFSQKYYLSFARLSSDRLLPHLFFSLLQVNTRSFPPYCLWCHHFTRQVLCRSFSKPSLPLLQTLVGQPGPPTPHSLSRSSPPWKLPFLVLFFGDYCLSHFFFPSIFYTGYFFFSSTLSLLQEESRICWSHEIHFKYIFLRETFF